MAPWQYMDFDGNSPSKNKLQNFIHKPENKVFALAVAATVALNLDWKSATYFALYTAITLGINGLRDVFKEAYNAGYHLDAYPDTFVDVGESTRKSVEKSRLGPLKNLFESAAISLLSVAPIVGIEYRNNDLDLFTYSCFAATYGSYLFTRNASQDYRKTRVAEGHWNMYEADAPPEEEAVSSADMEFAPAKT